MALAASRDRWATREMIQAYGAGATLDELCETFMLIPWNFGVSAVVQTLALALRCAPLR